MGIERLIRRAAGLSLVLCLIFGATMLAITLVTLVIPDISPRNLRKTDVIVGLAAGMDPNGTLHPSTVGRVEKAVELWHAGVAPRLHFTGGGYHPTLPSAGQSMTEMAISQGVPAQVISHEGHSWSTLQNALFSQPMLQEAESMTLVTEGFHLARSYLSFKWAGEHSIQVAFSERFRDQSSASYTPAARLMLREAVAIWFNLGRALLYDGAGMIGISDGMRRAWLQ